ncbi:hypothetical protein [Caballeronia udeis]|uniref:hypothetical protein n=1 Tax=Caballeronia udeis TaxID=1232866 RepID=UPI000785EC63|nr:hypothetical protein [Caballeronia udeis]
MLDHPQLPLARGRKRFATRVAGAVYGSGSTWRAASSFRRITPPDLGDRVGPKALLHDPA